MDDSIQSLFNELLDLPVRDIAKLVPVELWDAIESGLLAVSETIVLEGQS